VILVLLNDNPENPQFAFSYEFIKNWIEKQLKFQKVRWKASTLK
jgi:hypothetical protein